MLNFLKLLKDEKGIVSECTTTGYMLQINPFTFDIVICYLLSFDKNRASHIVHKFHIRGNGDTRAMKKDHLPWSEKNLGDLHLHDQNIVLDFLVRD